MLDNLLTLQELSGKLKVSKSTIFRLIKSHGLPAIKLMGSIRFNESQIESWIMNQSHVQGVSSQAVSKSVKKKPRIRPDRQSDEMSGSDESLFKVQSGSRPMGSKEVEAVFQSAKGYPSRPVLIFQAGNELIEVEGKKVNGKTNFAWEYNLTKPVAGDKVTLSGYDAKGRFRVTGIRKAS